MDDLLFKDETGVFSYRVAGVCVREGRVLLQTTTGEDRSFGYFYWTVLISESLSKSRMPRIRISKLMIT